MSGRQAFDQLKYSMKITSILHPHEHLWTYFIKMLQTNITNILATCNYPEVFLENVAIMRLKNNKAAGPDNLPA